MNGIQSDGLKGNILIVDDISHNLQLLSRTLIKQGYEVRGVVSGTMALRVVQTAPPDLILLDIKMPDMSGYEVCRHLKASPQTQDIPVIFISALDEVFDKVKAFELGGVDYVTKPFQAEEVLARIKTHLALQQAKAEIRKANAELEQRVAERTAALKQANAELIESEQRFRIMANSAPVLLWLADTSGACTFFNQRWLEFTGRTLVEEVNYGWVNSVHPDDRQQCRALYEAAFESRQKFQMEYRLRRADGSYEWILDSGMPRYLQDGTFAGYIGSCTEISDRKRAEAAMHHQAEQERLIGAIAHRIRQSLDLNTILNTTVAEVRQFLQVDRVLLYQIEPDGSGTVVVESVTNTQRSILGQKITDPCFVEEYIDKYRHGRVRTMTDVYEENLLPCHAELLASMQIRASLVVPVVQDQVLWGLLVAHHCSAPRQWQTLEVNLLQQLSTQVAIAIQQSELYTKLQAFNASLEEQVQLRTEQLQQSLEFESALKRITDRVRDSLDENQILQAVVYELAHVLPVECCDTGIYSADLKTSTILFEYTHTLPSCQGTVIPIDPENEIYRQLLRCQSTQLCPKEPLWTRNDNSHTILSSPIFDDQGVIGDIWLFKTLGSWFEDSEVRLVQQVANQCAIAVRQARLYKAAQEQVNALETLHQMKDDFLSTVSHELRSPVTNMKMSIQMLSVTLDRLKAIVPESSTPSEPLLLYQRFDQYLKILDSECEREISLVNDLLDLQRLEAKARPVISEPIDLKLWLPIIIDSFQERAQVRQQTLKVTISEALPFIFSDPEALSRIVAELLHNACKYTPPGETIEVTAMDQADVLQICVTNYGTEIPAQELPYVFEKFYRVVSTDRWQQGGTGLGLALVKKLVEHLQGKVHLTSAQGRTTFTIQLPHMPAVREQAMLGN